MKKLSILSVILLMFVSINGCATHPKEPSEVEEMIIEPVVSYADALVAYLGPEGTYTQEACQRFFDEEGTYIPYQSVSLAVEALMADEAQYAVIPQENTIGGVVLDYIDVVIAQSEVSVCGEVELPISQNLLAMPGVSISEINKVYSHPQGLSQSKEFLEQYLPQAELIETSSTAEAARVVSQGEDPSAAAIGSSGSAEIYGLEIISADIQNNDANKTRFYVLSKEAPAKQKAERLAFIATGKAEQLPEMMATLEEQGMVLVTIHDRPLKTQLGEYAYLIECSEASYEDYQKLSESCAFSFRYLGSYSVK